MDIGDSSGWGVIGRYDSKKIELEIENIGRGVGAGVDRDVGVEVYSVKYIQV